jgi:hypothetical protein
MSNPDRLAALKAKVDVYESEILEAAQTIQANPFSGTPTQQVMWMNGLLKFIDVSTKLLFAYREYTKELEKLVPR